MKTTLGANLIFSLSVDCAPPLEVGEKRNGTLYVIPIIGGTFQGDGMGEGIKGKVIAGGFDYNTRFKDENGEVAFSHVKATYQIITDDGVVIAIDNEGYKSWDKEKLTQIITTPKFTVAKGSKYDYLNVGVYCGSLTSRPDKTGVEINIYRLD